MDASDVGAELKDVLIAEERLRARVIELAAQIDADYAGRELLLVGVLKGAVMVMADLARAMHLPVQMDWMAVSSYGSGTRSSGVVRILKDLDTDITGKDVLVVEDAALVGGLALERVRRLGVSRYRFAGSGALCPDHLDLLMPCLQQMGEAERGLAGGAGENQALRAVKCMFAEEIVDQE